MPKITEPPFDNMYSMWMRTCHQRTLSKKIAWHERTERNAIGGPTYLCIVCVDKQLNKYIPVALVKYDKLAEAFTTVLIYSYT